MTGSDKIRVSQHSGRTGSAKHNDRTFMTGRGQDWIEEHASHIDQERSESNLYTTWDGNPNFEESERHYYEQTYQDGLDATNAHYRHEGHADRCKTIDDLYTGKLTRPEEMILQIGDRSSGIDGQSFKAAVEDYLGRLAVWNDEHGGHMIFLTAAIHLDEGSPHAHIRRVWEYQDAAGHTRLGQNKALQAAGIEPPQPGKPLGRYNNRKMSFDAMARGIWQETCREHGFDIETEARPGMRHKEKRDFIYDQMTAEIDTKRQEMTQATAEADRSRQEATKAAQAEQEARAQQKAAEADYKATEGKLRDAQAELEAIRERTRILTEQEARRTAKRGKSLFGLTLMHTRDYEALSRTAEAAEQATAEAADIKARETEILEAAERQRQEIIGQAVQERDKAISDRDAAKREQNEIVQDCNDWLDAARGDVDYLTGVIQRNGRGDRLATKLRGILEYRAQNIQKDVPEGHLIMLADKALDRIIDQIPKRCMPDILKELQREERDIHKHERSLRDLSEDLEL